MSASPVDRARELLEGITPGPWTAIQSPRSCEFVSSVWAPNDHQVARLVEHMEQNVAQEHRDAAFIAAAPELVADLLAEVGRLERDRDEARACAASERNQAVNLIASWRRSAKCLRGEVERGICIRQSAEEKLRAAGVLEVCADELERTGGHAYGRDALSTGGAADGD